MKVTPFPSPGFSRGVCHSPQWGGFADSFDGNVSNPDHSTSEQRFITIWNVDRRPSFDRRPVDRNENIRIVSARKTTPRERKHYEEKK